MYRIKNYFKNYYTCALAYAWMFCYWVIDWLFFRISYFACISLQTVSAPWICIMYKIYWTKKKVCDFLLLYLKRYSHNCNVTVIKKKNKSYYINFINLYSYLCYNLRNISYIYLPKKFKQVLKHKHYYPCIQ